MNSSNNNNNKRNYEEISEETRNFDPFALNDVEPVQIIEDKAYVFL
jgi:hypothetical protein